MEAAYLPPADAPARLAVTMGDPAGIGPEIVARLLASPEVASCRLLVVGAAAVLRATQESLGLPAREVVLRAADIDAGTAQPASVSDEPCIVDVDDGLAAGVRLGRVQAEAGELAYRSICAAVRLVQTGLADAVVTAPINKAALQQAGHAYPGHTELLAELGGSSEVAMMMAEDRLKVTLATIHAPLAQVPALLSTAAISSALRLTAQFLTRLGMPAPRLAVAGLNPHAGEGGLFGDEEETIIRPAVEAVRSLGIDVSGPLPGDVVFHQAVLGRYDAVIAMYHDQGLIPIKLLGFGRAVNVTLGLPFLRTSVDHGTAFDIAGRGVADVSSLKAATLMAARWAARWQRDL